MSSPRKQLLAIIVLIAATSVALAAVAAMRTHRFEGNGAGGPAGDAGVTLSAEVVQDKILKDGDGKVTVALHLRAAPLPETTDRLVPPADLVIVLDRSGSMQGRKLQDAQQAAARLIDQLTLRDRLALITYADRVQVPAPLTPVTDDGRRRLAAMLDHIMAGGGTNLGGGLQQGIALLTSAPQTERRRKLILISDGLANQGITDPAALGRMASAAVEHHFSISTVGVGLDFNEMLMSAIADQGAGSYHFLENPEAFASVFEAELQASRQVAAADVAIRIPLAAEVQLIDAGGYPIRHEAGAAVIHPGNLYGDRERTLHLTFQVPVTREADIALGGIAVDYRRDGRSHSIDLPRSLTVACVADATAAMASIKKEAWADQVVQEEFSRLKAAVAADIRNGDKTAAKEKIREYTERQANINAVVGSGKVAANLDTEVTALDEQVDETFAGSPAAVAQKTKQVSKSLQYDGYQKRRDKK